jgi:hypothetical protein
MASVADRLANTSPELAREAQRLVENLTRMSPEGRKLLLARLRANLTRVDAGRRFELLYPDKGALRRELYPKHVEFFDASADYTELAIIGANRSGKTTPPLLRCAVMRPAAIRTGGVAAASSVP